ncbi:DNA modification methylase/transcriptional regulator with XRE-family HTH domain/DNA-directed RNA polymerase subunit RPC12/RpoP [Nitrobacter vulgaris]|uniref:DNA methyltransferase n=1 Tax=Nitrobacter vulgaris TaxID=29421 RepID=UPI0028643885|nr:DNA methyltransferase [Nitrobacter vulgaris]MDR6302567.1 DNA modification methylase/transcriptional regulator with XRE-family HTH domain/DNA-directed RNA polymerase subunit RPC12/RpoP [Nitrobacter vulgaris]
MAKKQNPSVLRSRREALGLSQAQVVAELGVTKSLLSLIENGKRQLTTDQVSVLAKVLRVPPDLLLLEAGKLPDDVQGVFEHDAAEVVAAVRQRTEAHALAYPTAPEVVPIPTKAASAGVRVDLPKRINVRKTSTSYRAHSYHTKVPPEAIQPFISAFSRPGETVFDPFCGSGMTGVAALNEGRNALLSDLSPAAVHIARNYTTWCDPEEFSRALSAVDKEMKPTIDWLYRPVGSKQMVEYTTWSDVYRCPKCRARISYWDLVNKGGLIENDRIECPKCNTKHRKAELEWSGEVPVQSHTSNGSRLIDSHRPTRAELALVEDTTDLSIPYWIPQVPFGADREMWRASHRSMGIQDVAGFFTKRNLYGLAALRHAIIGAATGRVREALMFAFTGAVNRASRRYQWNAKRPTNVMTGTLYISSLRYEWNVWSLFRRKAADTLRYYQAFPKTTARADVFQRSATDLNCLPDGSVDMVFMDPPFGSNIFYADSSLLWEAWLGDLTDQSSEIVVNKHRSSATGGKSLQDYTDLMTRSFAEAARVLKRGGRAVLAFSNTDGEVWESIQKSLSFAGFDTASVHTLSKGQPSIKGVKGVSGKENVTTLDLMLCLEHRKTAVQMMVPFPPPHSLIDQAIRDAITSASEGQRTDEVYSAVVRGIVEANYSVSGISMSGVAARCKELGAVLKDGLWSLPKVKQAQEDYFAGYLSRSINLPCSESEITVTKPLGLARVAGGRNSAFYMAHSYHTKVPPEAIHPFIEHYTKPGDVVLDPFCGSGMTGVAAALSGRRAILNDLSPAAVHLAWNHTQPCDPEALAAGFSALEARVEKRFKSMYRTRHSDGQPARIHWTMWSTKHRCPACSNKFMLWEAIDRESGRLGKTIVCPNCKSDLNRSRIDLLGSSPAWIAYATEDGRRFEKAPDEADIKLARSFRREDISLPYPTTPVASDREMYIRCALQLQKIASVADFYTPRNLAALSILWSEILATPDERVRRGLAFAFTNTAWHGTRMRRFNARGGQRPLTGTLYIPQLSSEANVLEVMRNKIGQLQKYYRTFRPLGADLPNITLGSATHLSSIADASIDYVFTDPPFGSNIFYADCNLIWEAWLGRITNANLEAVVNRSLSAEKGGKSLRVYGDLIRGAMQEIARVLKPGGWATIVFHNTDAEVWQVIRDAAQATGFTFHEASSLDRQQQSHKGYKGRSESEDVAHFDVVFNLQKSGKTAQKPATNAFHLDLDVLIETLAQDPEISSRGLQGLHAEVMRRLASAGAVTFVDFADIRACWNRIKQSRSLRAS